MSSNIPQKIPQSGIPKPATSGSTSSRVQPSSKQPAGTLEAAPGKKHAETVPPTGKKPSETAQPPINQPSKQAPTIDATAAKSSAKAEMSPPARQSKTDMPPNWGDLEAKYKQDIEALTESTEMATIEKEIAEEKLDNCERELQEVKDKLAEASLQIETLKRDQVADQSKGAGNSESTVTVYQLQKVEEQNELLKQALIKLRDISTKDKQALEDLRIDHGELQVRVLDLEEKEQRHLEQIKIFEEQIDANQSAQEMVEKLTQQKTELEDKLKEMIDDFDDMDKLRILNEQLLESARENEIELTGELDRMRVQYSELMSKKRDMEDYLTDQERSATKLKDEIRILNEQIIRLKDQFKEGESIEQQKHQIENVAYKLNFSESKMAEKEAEISRYKRNLHELEEQMTSLSLITKEQAMKMDELKLSYDNKVSENSELQRALKKKMEEVSELEIRRDMAEKKLQALQRDTETKITNLTRTIETMRGMEIQHEEDVKRLMEDNELIERERRELREQLNRSNRSLERSTQPGNMSMSMVTALDSSLVSLGINFPTTQPDQASPLRSQLGGSSFHQPQYQQAHNQSMQPIQTCQTALLNSISGQGRTHASLSSSEVDDSIFMGKIKDLSSAFDQLTKKNYELECDLAIRELDNRIPPYNGSSIASHYDMDRAKVLSSEVQKLKREVRAAIINQQVCTKSRNVLSQARNDRFNNSKLAVRYQILENEANAIMSNSSLARMRPRVPLLQSTPVK